jgi:hypothetical protein
VDVGVLDLDVAIAYLMGCLGGHNCISFRYWFYCAISISSLLVNRILAIFANPIFDKIGDRVYASTDNSGIFDSSNF